MLANNKAKLRFRVSLGDQIQATSALSGSQLKSCDLSWCKSIQSHVRTDEVEEKYESRNHVVGSIKVTKPILRFVPSLELLVKALNEVVGNIILEALNLNVVDV